jgi:hypothetical protein
MGSRPGIPQVTARIVTARSEHALCNPHDVIREVLRLARNQKTTAFLTAIVGGQAIGLDINPSYIVAIEYLPTEA